MICEGGCEVFWRICLFEWCQAKYMEATLFGDFPIWLVVNFPSPFFRANLSDGRVYEHATSPGNPPL